jgi:hypothetical protein
MPKIESQHPVKLTLIVKHLHMVIIVITKLKHVDVWEKVLVMIRAMDCFATLMELKHVVVNQILNVGLLMELNAIQLLIVAFARLMKTVILCILLLLVQLALKMKNDVVVRVTEIVVIPTEALFATLQHINVAATVTPSALQ